MLRMTETMRWFGPDDPMSLGDISQCGCEPLPEIVHENKPAKKTGHFNLLSTTGETVELGSIVGSGVSVMYSVVVTTP